MWGRKAKKILELERRIKELEEEIRLLLDLDDEGKVDESRPWPRPVPPPPVPASSGGDSNLLAGIVIGSLIAGSHSHAQNSAEPSDEKKEESFESGGGEFGGGGASGSFDTIDTGGDCGSGGIGNE